MSARDAICAANQPASAIAKTTGNVVSFCPKLRDPTAKVKPLRAGPWLLPTDDFIRGKGIGHAGHDLTARAVSAAPAAFLPNTGSLGRRSSRLSPHPAACHTTPAGCHRARQAEIRFPTRVRRLRQPVRQPRQRVSRFRQRVNCSRQRVFQSRQAVRRLRQRVRPPRQAIRQVRQPVFRFRQAIILFQQPVRRLRRAVSRFRQPIISFRQAASRIRQFKIHCRQACGWQRRQKPPPMR